MTSRRQDIKSKKLKIACLHGYGTNKEFMKMQMQAFLKDFEDIVQFIFLDAPHIIPIQFVIDPKVLKNIRGQARTWIDWRVGRNNFITQTKPEPFKMLKAILIKLEKFSKKHQIAMMEYLDSLKALELFKCAYGHNNSVLSIGRF